MSKSGDADRRNSCKETWAILAGKRKSAWRNGRLGGNFRGFEGTKTNCLCAPKGLSKSPHSEEVATGKAGKLRGI